MSLAASSHISKDLVLEGLVCVCMCACVCAFFPDLHLLESQVHLPGFVQRQTSGRDSFERSSFVRSYRTPPGHCLCVADVGLPHCHDFHDVSPRQVEGEPPVITYPDHETNISAPPPHHTHTPGAFLSFLERAHRRKKS